MFAATFEIGPTLSTTVVAAIGALSVYFSRKAAKQLQNNGGSTALDKLQQGQADLSAQVSTVASKQVDISTRLTNVESIVTGHTKVLDEINAPVSTPLPPPPPKGP